MSKKIYTNTNIGNHKKKWISKAVEAEAKKCFGRYCEPQIISFDTVVVAADGSRYYLGLMKIAQFDDEDTNFCYEDCYWVDEEDEQYLLPFKKCFVARKVQGQKATVKFHEDIRRVRVGLDIFDGCHTGAKDAKGIKP